MATVILLCAAARPDVRNSANSVAASLAKIVFMVSSEPLLVGRTIEQRSPLEKAVYRHCEPTGRANARPMTGSAKQSISPRKRKNGLLRRGVYHRAGRKPDPLAPRHDGARCGPQPLPAAPPQAAPPPPPPPPPSGWAKRRTRTNSPKSQPR